MEWGKAEVPRVAGRNAGVFRRLPYGNDAHSHPPGLCVHAWESPFPQQHLNPLPNLTTFPRGAGIAGICSLHGKREARKLPSTLPRSPGKAARGAQPFTRHQRSPSRKRTPGKLPAMLVPCHSGGDTHGGGGTGHHALGEGPCPKS